MGRDPVELAKRAKYQPPAMRVRVDCYTKKLPFGLQSIQSGYKGYYFHSVIDCFMDQVQKKDISLRKIKK